jgi:gliding motility-associated-like protein
MGPSGCSGITPYSFTVTCDPDPLITNTGNTQTICSNSSVGFTPSSAVTGSTFSWTSTASSANISGNTLSGSGNISDVLVNSGTTSETVTYVISSSGPAPSLCAGSSTFTLTVTVDPVPVITNASNTQTMCSMDIAAFTPASSVPGTTYTWTATSSSASVSGYSASGTGNISESLTNSGLTAETVTYAITPVGPAPGSCTSSTPFNFVVTVNPTPVADSSSMVVTSADCGSSTGSITGLTTVSGTAPFTYVWLDAAFDTVGTSIDLTNVGAGLYTLIITDANGCSSIFGGNTGINVSQSSSVVASFTANPLSGETPLSVDFTNTSTGAVNYSWAFGTGDVSNATNPTYIYQPLGNFTACLVADNGAGCYDTACSTIDVYLNSVFIIPNIFTPNGDNVNDVFGVQAIGLSTLDADVFNRWGQKEYEWHTTNGGWDGRTASGLPAPDGTYFFMIKAKGIDGKEYFEKGSFTLMR